MMYYTRATIRIPSPSIQFTDAVHLSVYVYGAALISYHEVSNGSITRSILLPGTQKNTRGNARIRLTILPY